MLCTMWTMPSQDIHPFVCLAVLLKVILGHISSYFIETAMPML